MTTRSRARCQLLSDDFLQYYLGAIYNDDAGTVGGTDETPATPLESTEPRRRSTASTGPSTAATAPTTRTTRPRS